MIKKQENYKKVDSVIIGAGIFGLYAALLLAKRGQRVAIIDKSNKPFSRASAINQARVHNGYHYPRSYETAKNASTYYNRFVRDFSFAISDSFQQIYAIAKKESKTSTRDFIAFCQKVGIPLEEINPDIYFKKNAIDAAFLTEECSFDFTKIRDYLINKIKKSSFFYFSQTIKSVKSENGSYVIELNSGKCLEAPLVINASYSGINDIINKFNQEPFNLKYELCEIAFCKVPQNLKKVGITVMDGDFFSVMPFGKSNMHTLSSVSHTPHIISYNNQSFGQIINQHICKMHNVRGCMICSSKLKSKWQEMYILSQSFLKPGFRLRYKKSKFEVKVILKDSEIDDSRPTIIKYHTTSPTFVSVLSGKITTIYDLERVCNIKTEQPIEKFTASILYPLVNFSQKVRQILVNRK